MDDDSPEAWMAATKRTGAIRMLVIGLLLVAGGAIWGLRYWSYAVTTSPITYVRVVTVLVLAIGAGLAGAGAAQLARRR